MRLAVVTWLFNADKEVLMLKRSPGKAHAGQWCFPGGKLDYLPEQSRWETYEEAAVRETLEETGYQITSMSESDTILADSEYVVKVFLVHDYHDTTKSLESMIPNAEHEEFIWIKPLIALSAFKDFIGPMSRNMLIYLKLKPF